MASYTGYRGYKGAIDPDDPDAMHANAIDSVSGALMSQGASTAPTTALGGVARAVDGGVSAMLMKKKLAMMAGGY